MSFRHHLCPDEHDAVGFGEAGQSCRQGTGPFDRVGVQANAFELGHFRLKLALQALRSRSETGELCGAAGRARLGFRLGCSAMVAAQPAVPVQHEGNVAVVAA